MKLERRHTTPGQNPLDQVEYVRKTSVITNPDGSEVFRMDHAEVPAEWSQLATDIVVSKYFRKRGVPETGHETSVRQVMHRVAHTIRKAGEEQAGTSTRPKTRTHSRRNLPTILYIKWAPSTRPCGSTADCSTNMEFKAAVATGTGIGGGNVYRRPKTRTPIPSVRPATSSPSRTTQWTFSNC